MPMQRTIKQIVSTIGIGLHSGQKVKLTFYPAPVNTGIIFRRVDLTPGIEIPALATYVGETRLATTLIKDGAKLSTVEHLLAALAGLGIDNLYIDVDAEELPIMDGSAGPYMFLLQSAGIESQHADKRFIRIKKPIIVEEGTPGTADYKYAKFLPYHGVKYTFTIEFNHPLFNGPQSLSIDLSKTSFDTVSRARTFGFKSEYEWLRAHNLALGGSLDNAIVIDDYGVLNEGGLRYPDEFVRHKILDAVGDLSMLGAPVLAEFEGYKSGHAMNNQLLQAVLANVDAWEWATYSEQAEMPICYPEYILSTHEFSVV